MSVHAVKKAMEEKEKKKTGLEMLASYLPDFLGGSVVDYKSSHKKKLEAAKKKSY